MTQLDEILQGVESVAIGGHVRPDGDCISSCLATYNYIRTYYPKIDAALYLEPIPNIFKFLTRADEIISENSREKVYDLFIAQDCGDIGRLGDAARYCKSAKRTVCIDHHISNTGFADEDYIDPEASSTSELIYRLLPKERITKEIAECIYTGMVHDTGVFHYSCTKRATMEAAGHLMELGINYPKIVDDTYYTKTFEQNRILGLALLKSERSLDGRFISSVITEKEMQQYHVLPKHLEGIVAQLRSTKDVEVAVFLYQTGADDYKVSLRSSQEVDVARIAVSYGGGGHIRAAGCTVCGEAEQIIARLKEQVAAQMREKE